jgi:plastocyanin
MSQGMRRSRAPAMVRRWAAVGLATGLALSTVATVAPAVSAQTAPLKVGAGAGTGTVSGNTYLPGAFTVNVGDTVTFQVMSDESHTVTFGLGPADVAPPFWPVSGWTAPAPDAVAPVDLGVASYGGTEFLDTGIVSKGTTASVTFTAAGTFPFFCAIHQGMSGEVTVVDGGTATTQAEADAAATATSDALLGQVDAVRAARLAETTTTENADGTRTFNVFADAGTDPAPQPGGGTGYLELLEFTPAGLEIGAGDTVHWTVKNVHSITFVPDGVDPSALFTSEEAAFAPIPGDTYDGTAAVSSGVIGLGPTAPKEFALTFPTAGTYPFFCLLHSELGQVGTVTAS